MNKKQVAQLIHDREILGLSYRNLGNKYKIDPMTARRIIKTKEKKQVEEQEEQIMSGLPDDVELLKEELRKARLKIELQDLMIDIASKELGVDIRKKSGTRQSK